MSHIEQHQNQLSDEISLVDLATIFVRRRYVFYVVFAAVVLAALLYSVFMIGEAREYTTLVQLGEKVQEDNRLSLERPATVIATLQARLLPEQQALFSETNGVRMPFSVEAGNPKDTLLIRLTSTSSPANADAIKKTHETLVGQIVERQERVLEREKSVLKQRLQYVNEYLKQNSGEEVVGMGVAEAVKQRVQIVSELESLTSPEVLAVAREGLENKGTSKVFVMVLAVFMGFLLALISTFTAEFVAKVRLALQPPPQP